MFSAFLQFLQKRQVRLIGRFCVRARAIENLCYVLAPNQIGKDNRGLEAYGNSMIVDPWGKIVARGSLNNEEIVYGVMDKSRIVEARNIFGR